VGLGGVRLQLTPQDLRVFAQAMGVSQADVRSLAKQVIGLLPAMIPLYAGLLTLEGAYFSRWVLGARHHELPVWRPFATWEAPAWLPPLYLALFAVQVMQSLLNLSGELPRWIGFAVIWTQTPLAVIGIAVLSFWMLRARLPLLVRVIAVGLIILIPSLWEILVWVGILDGFIDLRRMRHAEGA